MENLKAIADWFLNLTKNNQIAIILIAVLSVMYVDRKDFKNELKTLKNDRRKIDSTYVARLNRVTMDFQKKIDDCTKERNAIYTQQIEIWQKKYNEVFEKTDIMYHQINKNKQ